jgi:hypothetical protein
MPDEIAFTISRELAYYGTTGFFLGWMVGWIVLFIVTGTGKGHDSQW